MFHFGNGCLKFCPLLGFHGLGNWLFLIVGRGTEIFASKRIEYNVQYLSMKEGSLFLLFCLYQWDPLNWDASDLVLDLFGKLLKRTGAWAWFYGVWTCDAKVLEYWMISSLKIKLNRSWKFQRNWNVPLVLLERSWWAGFNGIYMVRFWIQNVRDIDF
jgi:hypothetical protein